MKRPESKLSREQAVQKAGVYFEAALRNIKKDSLYCQKIPRLSKIQELIDIILLLDESNEAKNEYARTLVGAIFDETIKGESVHFRPDAINKMLQGYNKLKVVAVTFMWDNLFR